MGTYPLGLAAVLLCLFVAFPTGGAATDEQLKCAAADPARCFVSVKLPPNTCSFTPPTDEQMGSSSFSEFLRQSQSKCDPPKLSLCPRVEELSGGTGPFYMVVIAGVAREGKSFLANAIMAKLGGGGKRFFPESGLTEACTLGADFIWFRLNSGGVMLLVDLEGSDLGDVRAHFQLMALAAQNNAVLIYNKLGVLNDQTLERVSKIAWATQEIKRPTKPHLILVSNQADRLEPSVMGEKCTPKAYIDHFMKAQEVDSDSRKHKKKLIRETFQGIDYYIVPTLATHNQAQFDEAIDRLSKAITAALRPIEQDGHQVTGDELAHHVLPALVASINEMKINPEDVPIGAIRSLRACTQLREAFDKELPPENSDLVLKKAYSELEAHLQDLVVRYNRLARDQVSLYGAAAEGPLRSFEAHMTQATNRLLALNRESRAVKTVTTEVSDDPDGPITTRPEASSSHEGMTTVKTSQQYCNYQTHYRSKRTVTHLKNGQVELGEWSRSPQGFEKKLGCWTEETKRHKSWAEVIGGVADAAGKVAPVVAAFV